jgi:Protein NO VEIN, C-terminal
LPSAGHYRAGRRRIGHVGQKHGNEGGKVCKAGGGGLSQGINFMAGDSDWTRFEVETTIADYLHMLVLEYSGQSYNKAAHRRALQAKLNNRTEGAIELKHQNISAVLHELGFHWIPGYKPRGHYQTLLRVVVEEQLAKNKLVDEAALSATSSPAAVPLLDDFNDVLVEAPKLAIKAKEPSPRPYSPSPIKRDYLEREARNISLGKAGEEFVLKFEHFRLYEIGQKKLADNIEHVSVTRGDGMGYDILSFDSNGRERYIEVKTTAFAKETPFFISSSEIEFAKDKVDQFHLYRLYEFRKSPKLFDLPGSVEKHCSVNPVSFICEFS